jgi:hypothetical protein
MTDVPVTRKEVIRKIKADFRFRHSDYDAKKDTAGARWKCIKNKLDPAKQPASWQRMLEASWLISYTEDWARVGATLNRVEKELGQCEPPLSQQADGSWSMGYTEPFHKLEPTVDALQRDNLDCSKLMPLAFMKDYQDPGYVKQRLDSLRVSIVRDTGVNNRAELGAVMTALSQIIFKKKIRDLLENCSRLAFKVSPQLEQMYTDYLWRMQNSGTGYWGPTYRFPDGTVEMQDLSFTFHVVHYYDDGRGRTVPNPAKINATTIAIFDPKFEYPSGWVPLDRKPLFLDHNNYDAVTLFSCGWNIMTAAQQKAAKDQMQTVLTWCLTDSFKGDSFVVPEDVNPVDEYYFGVKFLNVIGFWNPGQGPWPADMLTVPPRTPKPKDAAAALYCYFRNHIDDGSPAAETTKKILEAVIAGRTVYRLI